MSKENQRHGKKEQTDSDQRGEGKEGEWYSQGKCTGDPLTKTTVWGLTMGMGGGVEQGRATGRKLGQL